MKAGQASATAKVIAASTVLLASRPVDEAIVPAGAAELSRHFLSTSRADRLLVRSVRFPGTRWLWRCLEQLTHPGIMRHYLLRKRCIEAQCRLALRQGFGRVIVIGAGLDTLALRLAPLFPEVSWTEVDHPATQDLKLQALTQAGLRLPANMTLLGVDLSAAPLPAALKQDDRPTLVIIEGVLMYLSEADVTALLGDQVRKLSSGPVRLIFSYMTRWAQGRDGFRPSSWLVDWWLAWRDEPFRWTLPAPEVAGWLRGIGYELVRHAEPPFDLEAAAPHDRLKGENLVICETR